MGVILKNIALSQVDETMLRAWLDAGYLDPRTYDEEIRRRRGEDEPSDVKETVQRWFASRRS